MKVLFATYPMAFHTPGGGEVQLLAYRKALAEHGVEVTLMDPWNPRFLDHDVVHFFSCVGGSVHFCNFVKQLGLPLVISSSLWITESTKGLYPIDEIRHQLSLSDRVITNSGIESDTLAGVLDLPRDRFDHVYNGVDAVFSQRPDASLFRQHFDIQGNFVLNVGNIEPRKNQLRLAEAMRSFPDRKLVLIGHVRSPEYFEQVKAAALPGQLQYLGPLPHDADLLRSAYQACELFCLPSTLETPGLAALEAAVQGSPLVITSEGSTREYFGDNAVYVSPEDAADIAKGMAQSMGATAMNRETLADELMKRFAWTSVVKKLINIYDKL
ncbi:glycosyltransferase [Hydrogenophaga sp. 5NK40-0174]|uniref:glycosyltransferase n=1 Tax=Hydrogenophaga sp. 5NK40-0174 TaxID=3127649 RepID=UPI0031032BF7